MFLNFLIVCCFFFFDPVKDHTEHLVFSLFGVLSSSRAPCPTPNFFSHLTCILCTQPTVLLNPWQFRFLWLFILSICWLYICGKNQSIQFSRSVVSDSATPWTAAHQASLSITNSQSLLKLRSFGSVMPSNHLILCHPLLPPSSFPASGSFPVSQLFTSDGQSTGVSASAWIFRTDFL